MRNIFIILYSTVILKSPVAVCDCCINFRGTLPLRLWNKEKDDTHHGAKLNLAVTVKTVP